MKGYSKIKENHPLAQRSKSKKEYAFQDQDVDLLRSKHSSMQNPDCENDQLPSTIDNDERNRRKIELFLGKLNELEQNEPRKDEERNNDGGVLRRNYSVSYAITTNEKNKGKISNYQQIEKEGCSRSLQGAMKRAFSMRRSSSVSGSERYCRIYDQPMRVDHDGFDRHAHDYHDFERNNIAENVSMQMRSMSIGKKDSQNNGKKNVGSKVVKVCKRLFSR